MAKTQRTLTVPEAGEILGLGRDASYNAARRGEIPTIRIGRRLLVPRDQLDALLAGDWKPEPQEATDAA